MNSNKLLGTLVISDTSGVAMEEAEVRNLLAPYGEIQDVATVPVAGPRGFILPGYNVRFAYWQDARDALRVRLTPKDVLHI